MAKVKDYIKQLQKLDPELEFVPSEPSNGGDTPIQVLTPYDAGNGLFSFNVELQEPMEDETYGEI